MSRFDKMMDWVAYAPMWQTVTIGVLAAFALSGLIALPIAMHASRVDDERAARCAEVGAEPVQLRESVRFCKLPDGTIIDLPSGP